MGIGDIIIGALQFVSILLLIVYKAGVERRIGHQFDLKLEKFRENFEEDQFKRKREDRFKLACLDERLKAHQEAYAMSLDMIRTAGAGSDEETKRVRELYWTLFRERALYLTPMARGALNRGFKSFDEYNRLNGIRQDKLQENQLSRMQTCYEDIAGTASEIVKAIESQTRPDESIILPAKGDQQGAP